jgi:hypothetical protein
MVVPNSKQQTQGTTAKTRNPNSPPLKSSASNTSIESIAKALGAAVDKAQEEATRNAISAKATSGSTTSAGTMQNTTPGDLLTLNAQVQAAAIATSMAANAIKSASDGTKSAARGS